MIHAHDVALHQEMNQWPVKAAYSLEPVGERQSFGLAGDYDVSAQGHVAHGAGAHVEEESLDAIVVIVIAVYRGCISTSTSAGSPRFTMAMARLIAAPRSAGFEMGPSE